MKKGLILLFACLLSCVLACAQSDPSPTTTVAPGSSLPGFGGFPLGLDGPGYVEVGGGHSDLTDGYANWTDFYLRGVMSGGRNTWNGEVTHQDRFGETGWFYSLGLTRTLSENSYGEISAGGSADNGGVFLPRFRTDALINRKFLRRRQLVATAGVGFDQSKTVDSDVRGQVGAAYYFDYPVVVQGGFMWTYTSPGAILARTQYIAASQGHDKEHFVSLRYE